jgi:starvation-inducible DNA-binding protein
MTATNTPLHKSRIDLPEATRRTMIAVLNDRLADCIDLQTHAKQAHWNVKGPDFIQLHLLFDSINGHVAAHVDSLAERAAALGGTAIGTATEVAKRTKLKAYPLSATTGQQHLEALAGSLAGFGSQARAAIATADQSGDADTTDLFTQISRAIDQDLWMVEAHLQAAS